VTRRRRSGQAKFPSRTTSEPRRGEHDGRSQDCRATQSDEHEGAIRGPRDRHLAARRRTLRVLLASIEAELSERRERTALTDTTHAWLLSLGRRLDEIEEDTPEGFEKRKQLIGLLVKRLRQ
jgi:hypothetical protein